MGRGRATSELQRAAYTLVLKEKRPVDTPKPFVRKFSSQFPKAEIGTEPAWGIRAVESGPCIGCGRVTRFSDTAFLDERGAAIHICCEACLDVWLDLEEKMVMSGSRSCAGVENESTEVGTCSPAAPIAR